MEGVVGAAVLVGGLEVVLAVREWLLGLPADLDLDRAAVGRHGCRVGHAVVRTGQRLRVESVELVADDLLSVEVVATGGPTVVDHLVVRALQLLLRLGVLALRLALDAVRAAVVLDVQEGLGDIDLLLAQFDSLKCHRVQVTILRPTALLTTQLRRSLIVLLRAFSPIHVLFSIIEIIIVIAIFVYHSIQLV